MLKTKNFKVSVHKIIAVLENAHSTSKILPTKFHIKYIKEI